MKKIKLIYNSGAGQSKFKYFLDVIIEKFMENNCDVSVFRIDKNTNLYEYLKDYDISNDERAIELINLVSLLHSNTTRYNNISIENYHIFFEKVLITPSYEGLLNLNI